MELHSCEVIDGCEVTIQNTYQSGTERLPVGPYRTIQDHTGPYGTKKDHKGPYRTIQDHTVPYGTILDHMGHYETIADHICITNCKVMELQTFWLLTY